MQHRMKTHQLIDRESGSLLSECPVGTLATVSPDGRPYHVPIHYVYLDDAVYIHGLPAGQKIDNIKANPNVCFNVYRLQGLLPDPDGRPCDTNTAYASVVIQGTARLVEDMDEKKSALSAIVRKYTPHLTEKEIPPNMPRGTAVIKTSIGEMTGKYYS